MNLSDLKYIYGGDKSPLASGPAKPVDGPSEPLPTEARCAVSTGSAIDAAPEPLTPEEILTLKVAELTLHRGFVDSATRVLLRGVRPASKAQDLVLRADLEELKRRCDDAAKVSWPVLPNK